MLDFTRQITANSTKISLIRRHAACQLIQGCEGYRTAVFTDLRVKTSAHKGGPISRPATPTPPGHLLGTPWAPQDH